ncbi:hypothetical protein [Polynucleobacter rarus]|uniref:hypothetical protein n=1 Tax=Polynucleobacter rarus TaxID=556055 RepID=UPI000D3E9A21|nr:hypothetical protein [Polynucleobacter rarus]
MSLQKLESIYKLHENANATEQDLMEATFFDDFFAKKFEVSILPIEDNDNEGMFYLVTRIESKGSKLPEDQAEEICDTVSDKFFELISSVKTDEEVDDLRNYFSGPQFFLNGNQLY